MKLVKFPANSLQVPWSIANRQCLCWSGVKKYFCGNFFPAKFPAQGILGAEPPASARSHAHGLCCLGVLKTFQVVSWWGIPCRTPQCSGFAVLSAMVLKKGAKHIRPTERGVGTCESCGCQYSVRPEQLERRLVGMRTEAQEC